MFTDKYIGKSWVFGETDCAHLCETVLREEFNTHIVLPTYERASPFKYSQKIDEVIETQFEKIDDPRDGDILLMKCRGRLTHVGVWVKIGHTPHVLHSLKRFGSVLHKISQLENVALKPEGVYRPIAQ